MSALGGFEVRSRFAGYHYFHFVSFQPSGLLSIRNYSELLTTLYSSSPPSSSTMEQLMNVLDLYFRLSSGGSPNGLTLDAEVKVLGSNPIEGSVSNRGNSCW